MRTITVCLLAATLTIGPTLTAHSVERADKAGDPLAGQPKRALSASSGRWRGPCEGWRLGENLTPARWAESPARGLRMMRRLLACVFERWAPGQSATALYVMTRESSGYPWAANPSGCLGLMQHMSSLWAGRVQAFLWRGWFAPWVWPPSAFDPRANLMVTAKMVGPEGNWGPWSM